jgi:hypothetical protein
MMLAIEGKTGRGLVAVLESKEYRAWDAALNLKNLLVSVSRRHYNAILAWNRLGMNRGLHISDAPQGTGKLAYSGLYHDLARIDDARRLEAEKKGVTQ